ncbi:hypothetical protein [Geobacillus kaustophilus]|nr:hypothetical protein [Geobacillus kaustophilus]
MAWYFLLDGHFIRAGQTPRQACRAAIVDPSFQRGARHAAVG